MPANRSNGGEAQSKGATASQLFVGIPTAVSLPLGGLLIVYAAALWFTETRPTLNTSAVQVSLSSV